MQNNMEKLVNDYDSNIDEIYESFAADLVDSGYIRFAGRKSKARMIADAKFWLKANEKLLRATLCSYEIVRNFCQDDQSFDRDTILATLYDLLAPKFAGLPIGNLVILLAREALRSICSSNTSK